MIEVVMYTKVPTTPDACQWSVYDENEVLRATGVSSNLGTEPTLRGSKHTVLCDVPNLMPGSYQIELSMTVNNKTFTHSQTYVIEEDSHYDDGVICTLTPSLSFVSPIKGIVSISRGDDEYLNKQVDYNEPVDVILSYVQPSMEPLHVAMSNPSGDFEVRRWYYINPSIASAMEELRKYIDRLNQRCRLDSLKLTAGDYLDMLYAGMNMLNGIGLTSSWTMTKATGPIRQYWLLCSKYNALRVRYLEEGLTSFDYEGANISLTVDVTQYLESEATACSEQFDGIKDFKVQCGHSQNLTGSGVYRPGGSRAIGATGISIGPATGMCRPRF